MNAEVAVTQQPTLPDNALPREPAKAFSGKVQTPPAGSFNFFALTWDSKVSKGRTAWWMMQLAAAASSLAGMLQPTLAYINMSADFGLFAAG